MGAVMSGQGLDQFVKSREAVTFGRDEDLEMENDALRQKAL